MSKYETRLEKDRNSISLKTLCDQSPTTFFKASPKSKCVKWLDWVIQRFLLRKHYPSLKESFAISQMHPHTYIDAQIVRGAWIQDGNAYAQKPLILTSPKTQKKNPSLFSSHDAVWVILLHPVKMIFNFDWMQVILSLKNYTNIS